jgi:AGZA family xanthine/uracil permease-like MFS transporter
MAVLDQLKVKGAIMWGIIAGMFGAAFIGELDLPEAIFSTPPTIAPVAMHLDILSALQWSLLPVIFTFLFIDMFDSIGTVLACSYEAGMIEKDESLEEMPTVLKADAMATIIGSVLGSSTTTTYIESASGIASGARTGLSSVFVAVFFLVALFFSPLIAAVPDFAVAPALVLVGAYMFKLIRLLPFEDLIDIVPAFLTIILMPLTYSISTGLAFGFVSYAVIALMSGKHRSVSPLLWIVAGGAALMLAFH